MRTLLAALLLVLPLYASADTVIIEPVKDNTLYDEPTGALSNGAGISFFAGLTGEPRVVRGLLEFDVAGSVPAGSAITSATLTLHLIKASQQDTFTPNTVAIHTVSSEWGEGTSQGSSGGGGGGEGAGAPSTTNDATWIHTFYSTSTWGSAGGDFNPTVSASLLVGTTAGTFHSWSTAQLATDVQGFLDNPSGNHGWMVKGTETANARQFASRTHPTPANHPMLTIEFTPPAGGTGACCAPDGMCAVVPDPGGTCTSPDVYQGLATVCVPNSCPQPTGACCIPDASATCNEITAAACTTAGGSYQGNGSTCGASDCPVIPTAFLDPMPVPAVATPISGVAGGVASYDIAMREVAQTLHSELPATTVWAYDDGTGAVFPGPTIEATSDQAVTVNWINDLRDTSQPGDPKPLRTDNLLDVDLCPHGAEDNAKAVVHLHGAHTRAEFDGHPEDTFLPGAQDTYVYENHQLPSALWYHDHALGQTRLNVYLGLAGMYLIRDATENALGLPSGQYEVPLVIQDRSFNADGSLEYPSTLQQTFFGETMLVNGVVWPYFDVDQGKYRFRVVNGSNSRTLNLEFCTVQESPCTSPVSFDVLGQEGGLLPAPVSVTDLTLGPAERADIVVDFASYMAGAELYLVNKGPVALPDVMKFVVQNSTGFTGAVPGALRAMEVLDEQDAVVSRDFELMNAGASECSSFVWEIVSLDENGDPTGSMWVDVVEFPELGTTEVWNFINTSGMMHPMHLHLVFFQVLDRTPIDANGDPTGPAVAPPAEEAGWKDTVRVGSLEKVRVIARFEDYTGLFPYHCHILEHEDQEMMRQFQTISCGNGELEPTEECDDGNTTPGDGCSDTCEVEDDVSFYGQAQGGDVTITVDGVVLVVPTTAGQLGGVVAANVAAAIEADPTLSAAGVTAFADGQRVVTTGSIDSVVVNDPGLSTSSSVLVPALSGLGLLLLVGALIFTARQRRLAR